jgi:hypothetical protein
LVGCFNEVPGVMPAINGGPAHSAQQLLRSQTLMHDVASQLANSVSQESQRNARRADGLSQLSNMLQALRQQQSKQLGYAAPGHMQQLNEHEQVTCSMVGRAIYFGHVARAHINTEPFLVLSPVNERRFKHKAGQLM